jgi:3-hydroxyisobutyrate dehydrogenase
MTTVAVLGTGIMGEPIARNLTKGFDVRVWNRTRDKAQLLAEDGATVCDSPREAASGAGVVYTMLADADATVATMTGDDGALAGMADSATWIQAGTVGITGLDRLAALASDAGVGFVDAPVLGTRVPAEKAALVVIAAGPDELRQDVQPVFDAIGQRTMWVGDVGAASRLKLVANSWVLAVTTAVGEAMALAQGFELDPGLFLEAISGGALDLPYAHLKGDLIMAEEFPASFPIAGAAKDAGLIVAAGEQAGVHLEVAAAVHRQMTAARDAGHGDEDMAAVWYAARAGS